MVKLALAACVLLGASLGTLVGTRASSPVDDNLVTRTARLRDEVEHVRARFGELERELVAAQTPAAATAARAKLFQLRVDMVALEDELAVLARRSPAARE